MLRIHSFIAPIMLLRLLLLLCFAASTVHAQRQPSPTLIAQQAAMEHVAFLVGDWTGEGWMDMGERRASFRSSERVESRIDGLALVIEGTHTADIPGRADPLVVHHALAMLTFDPDSGRYRFNTQVHGGGSGVYQGHVENGAFVWEMTQGPSHVRYVIQLDDEGRWVETGERSSDGHTWTQFFEMTLSRTDAPTE